MVAYNISDSTSESAFFEPFYGYAGNVARWVLEEGMGIDAASRGELAVSLAALQEVDGEEATVNATRVDFIF